MSQQPSFEQYSGAIPDGLKSLHPVLQRVYASRGLCSVDDLDYSLNRLLHFKDLKNIDAAAALLADAIKNDKKIVIVGDFDTDGATSTTLAVTALRQLGARRVEYLIPNRFEYGYGLTPEIVAIANQPDLIMTVDNGISSHEGVIAAKQTNSQVLITDHHLPAETLPLADVIVNPQQPGDAFTSKNLAGVGVAFYVMLALRNLLQATGWFELKSIPYPKMHHLLDLVALGTVADMVPLDFNNRILVACGLSRIRSFNTREGIKALAEVSKCNLANCVESHLSFLIAPKLNAAGRIEDMSLGVACLLEEDPEKAFQLAESLNTLNKKRQSIEQTMQKKAFLNLNQLNLSDTQASICLFDNEWHQGITGLVAGRIKERFGKPTIVFAPTQRSDELKGSARSVPNIHIRDALATIATHHPHVLSRFGGHAAAAGLSIHKKHYPQFVLLFEEAIKRAISTITATSMQSIDGELTAKEFHLNLALLIREGGPWGQGFPEPIFKGDFQIISQCLVAQRHLSIIVQLKGMTRTVKAILFNANLDHWPNPRVHSVCLLYRLTVNEWEGRKAINLHIDKIYNITNGL